MSVTTVSASALTESGGAPIAQPQRHRALLLFCTSALVVGLSLNQTENFEVGSVQYWLLILPAVLLPMLNLDGIVLALLGRAKLLLVLLSIAGSWHLLRGDFRAVAQLGLFVWILTWLSTDRALLNVRDLSWLYLGLLAIGAAVIAYTEFNVYGLLPGQTLEEFGKWRVSFFSNVAYTGLLSLAMLLVLTKDRATMAAHPFVMMICSYFLVFSLVRAALLGMLLYALLWWWFKSWKRPAPIFMFWVSLLAAVGVNLLLAFSATIVESIQQLPLISTIVLQDKTDLSADEIWYQMYRPWLWVEHLNIFVSSPWLMGLGSFDFFQMYSDNADAHVVSAGSESLPTRLLATYGLPAILFAVYLVVNLRAAAFRDDRWACACFPTVFLVMMQWGSVLHPTDALFVLFLLMVVRGSSGYVGSKADRAGVA